MAAAVIDRLEAIQVHVEQHVHGFFCVCRIHRLVQAALELATIDKTGQRIMRGLVAHPASEPSQLADVVKHDDRARDTLAGAANRRCRQFDRMFLLAVLGDHDCPSSHVDAAAHREAPVHGITQRTPVRIIHQRE